MEGKNVFISTKLSRVLTQINSFHQLHGITIIDSGEKKSKWYKAWTFFTRFIAGAQMGLFLIGATPALNNNKRFEIIVCGFAFLMCLDIVLQELLFLSRKKSVMELISWCHRVETVQGVICHRPKHWFDQTREKVVKLVKLYVIMAVGYIISVFFVIAPTLTYVNGYPTLPYYINLKGFEEKSHRWVFVIEFLVGLCATFVIAQLCLFSLSFFILFSSYVIAQLELVAKYVSELPLNDIKLITLHLGDITELHIDALKTINKLSDLYRMTLKLHEVLLYCGVAIALIGKEGAHFDVITVPGYFVMFIGFYSYTVENIIQAEESIRLNYSRLNWDEANVAVRKILLIAMQQPQQISFGGIFGRDKTSRERFANVLRQAYDFGLILVKFAT